MFLHDYFLACEISTVRTQTLRRNNINTNYYVHRCVIGSHGNALLDLAQTKKKSE